MEMKLASTFFLKPAGLIKHEKIKFNLHVLSDYKLFEYEMFMTGDGMTMVKIEDDGRLVTLPEIVDIFVDDDDFVAISSAEWTFESVDGGKESKMTVRLGATNDVFENIGIASTRLERCVSEGFFQDPKTVAFRAIGIGDKKSIQAPDQTIMFFKETKGLENDKRFTENVVADIEVRNGKISDEPVTVRIAREDWDSKVNTGVTCKRLKDDKDLSDLTDQFIDRIHTFLMLCKDKIN